jgi:Protein-tyrosine-phosphatase
MAELERRAAVHGALGEPGRLAIVDALVLGDASPSHLQRSLGMASNLLAHHVDVLEGVGVVRRIRSEGDRRRSYLTLLPGALDGLLPVAAVVAPRILFVCTENAARSQLAAALWAGHSAVPAASAGTHPAPRVNPGAIAAARRHDVPLEPRQPRLLDEVVRAGDVVITVCDRAHEELPASLRHAHWSVADPARPGTDDAFDRSLRELTGRIARFAPTVSPS